MGYGGGAVTVCSCVPDGVTQRPAKDSSKPVATQRVLVKISGHSGRLTTLQWMGSHNQ